MNSSTAQKLLAYLNAGQIVPTYRMALNENNVAATAGELRYLQPYIDDPYDRGAVIPLTPVRIVWTGEKWEFAP